jgi:hypothetical protein
MKIIPPSSLVVGASALPRGVTAIFTGCDESVDFR